MDEIDAALLRLLQVDCTRSYADLGKEVGLSVTPVLERLKKLRARGCIRAHVALVEPHSVGLDVGAFIAVLIERSSHESAFLDKIVERGEVQECHLTSGEYPILLKVRMRDADALNGFVGRIKAAKGVLRVHVDLIMSTRKDSPAVPV